MSDAPPATGTRFLVVQPEECASPLADIEVAVANLSLSTLVVLPSTARGRSGVVDDILRKFPTLSPRHVDAHVARALRAAGITATPAVGWRTDGGGFAGVVLSPNRGDLYRVIRSLQRRARY